ncbi:MAG: UDP-N-acetylglucosamine 1-carboxyvinyltransferase [Oceanicaulis sp.]
MDRIVIRGGRTLNGRIEISGAKNSALKLMAASLLTAETLTLTRMPRLADTRFLGKLLEHLGVEVREEEPARTVLKVGDIREPYAPYELVRKMRASFNVLGPLVAREGRAKVSLPGGCAIGARPVNLHLEALEALGAEIEVESGYVNARAPSGGLRGGRVTFPMVSVGATEHAMLAAVLANGETVLENCAREPEIADLAGCLNTMGAKIEGAGESVVRIQGVDALSGAEWEVCPDRIETGTFAIAAAAVGGEVRLDGAVHDHNGALWHALARAGAAVTLEDGAVTMKREPGPLRPVDVTTAPYPGFPTDLQAQFMALMSLADGASVIRETIFENRFMHAPELARLGANIQVRGNEAVVRGPAKLRGAPVMATDLRASVSLVIAGLAADGETEVSRIYHLDRGFERLEDKLSACGADISRVSERETA